MANRMLLLFRKTYLEGITMESQVRAGYKRYNYQKLFALAAEMMHRYGYSREDAEKIADVILTSDRYGVESHGVNRLTLYPYGIDIGRIRVDAKPEVVEDNKTMAVIDAHDADGHLAGFMGMELAIEKAKRNGVGMVSVRNSNHYGIAGYYSRMAAKEGLMGVSMTNAEATVVPTYAREPMVGTNPIAITIPCEPHPFHMDFATSIMTCGKMEVYAKTGHTLQPGMLVDEQGVTSLDPNKFLEIRENKTNPNYKEKTRGGIMPMGGEGMLFGGHKGFGFAMLVDIMCSIMSHGNVSKDVRVTKDQEKCTHFFAAIDYSLFGDKAETDRRLAAYLQSMRQAEPALGQERVYVHGDKEVESERDVLARGVAVNAATYAEIRKYCQKLGIDITAYMIEEEEHV